VASKRPIVITSYLGRQPAAVERLVEISDRIGVGVCEVSPSYLNFPGGHANHLGYRRNSFVEEADLILMLDVDVPWINGRSSRGRKREPSTSISTRSRLDWGTGTSLLRAFIRPIRSPR
jgi:thiamine pyrophosphate-dependent acetolactate synthase large subunit-like protein